MSLFDWLRRRLRWTPTDPVTSLYRAPDPTVLRHQQAVTGAQAQAWFTLLLREDLPSPEENLAGLFARAELERRGFRVELGAKPKLWLDDEHAARLYFSSLPFPRTEMDLRAVSEPFDGGRSFVGVALALPSAAGRKHGSPVPDAFSPRGSARRMAQLLSALLPYSTAVVFNLAGARVRMVNEVEELLGDTDDPGARPYGVFLDLALANGTVAASFGMETFGLPDVRLAVPPGRSQLIEQVSLEAVETACSRMLQEGRVLAEGELVEVACPRSEFGPPLPAYRFRVLGTPGVIELEATARRSDPLADWSSAENPLALIDYEALFNHHLTRALDGSEIANLGVKEASPPHSVRVLERSSDGFALVTHGIGRVPQVGAQGTVPAHVELVAFTPQHHPILARFLSFFGMMLHANGGNPWKAGDTVTMNDPAGVTRCFLLESAGEVSFGDGPSVTLLTVLPLAPHEASSVRRDPRSFRSRYATDEAFRSTVHTRWRTFVN